MIRTIISHKRSDKKKGRFLHFTYVAALRKTGVPQVQLLPAQKEFPLQLRPQSAAAAFATQRHA
jgi:hypothetical protein